MRVFVTGATGFIGRAVVRELLAAGHSVIGLTRTGSGADQLKAAGAEAHQGSLQDPASLRRGAERADAVIHLAFIHEFNDVKLSTRLGVLARGITGRGLISSFMNIMMDTDSAAIQALGAGLGNSGKPMVITVGTMGQSQGRVAVETDAPDPKSVGGMRSVPAEKAASALASRGIRTSVLRLPPSVHGDDDHHGFISRLSDIARKKGVSAYVGDGSNRWPAVHRLDAARLYRLVLENAPTDSRYHAVADEGVPFREIAEAIGKQLNVPVASKTFEEAKSHFSFLSPFVAADNPASSALTQHRMDWHPSQRGLLSDITRAEYFDR